MMRFTRVSPRVWVFFAVFSLASAASVHGSGATAADGLFEAGHLQAANDLPVDDLTSSLEALSPEARARALSQLQNLSPPAEDAAHLRADPEGSLLYVEFPAPETGEVADLASDTKDSGSYAEAAWVEGELIAETEAVAGDPSKVFRLHSRPGSSKVLFLDFDGHRLQNTIWNTIMGQSVLDALPFDTDFNDNPKSVANFTQGELNRIAQIWHRVAADFAPFDIDVTTEEPAVFTATTGHVIITDDRDAAGRYMPYFNSTGAAHVDVFGSSDYPDYPALVYWTNLYTYLQGYPAPVAESVSHEFGHHLGLSHDGLDSAPDYYWYQGHGLGLVSWAPIMGAAQGKEVTQWDRGEYPGATNFEDDLAIIGQKLGYIGDDHANSSSQATALVVDPDGTILASNPELDPDNVLTENKGIIGNRNDVDWFYVDVAGSGTLEITATPSWHAFTLPAQRGENLDIQLSLYNSSLTLITTDNPDDNTDATVTAAVTSGRYYLKVDGVGNSTNSDYSDYGSIGMYFIEGWVPRDGSPADTTPPSPTQMSWTAAPSATGTSSISMTAVTASDASGSVEYYFTCVSGGPGCSSSGWQTSRSYSDTGLQAGTSYSYNVRARDAAGNMNNPSATASATTDAATGNDTTPPSPARMSWQTPPTATGSSTISMTAVAATDASGYVEYYFACVSGNGCNSSGWQTSRTYTDSGLQANTSYSYKVMAQDAAGNRNNLSSTASATTDAVGTPSDTTPPSPSQMSWQSPPAATGTSSISMTAVTATDASGSVQYYFTCVSGGSGCSSSGWQTSRTFTDSGLQANTSYSYNVRARDAAGNMNNPSATASATTDGSQPPPANQPPVAVASYSPNPAQISQGNSVLVTLRGSASSDPDGSIVAWSWRNSSGSVVGTSSQYSEDLREGTHAYTLVVTDNKGATDAAAITVTVLGRPKGKP